MAAGDPYFSCSGVGQDITVDSGVTEILNALGVVTSTGIKGIRTVVVSVAEANISSRAMCAEANVDFKQWLIENIRETASGKPAIALITEA
jgi:hypothetical protein